MTQGSPPLRLVGPPPARRLESRRQIEEWASERYRTLMALVEAEEPAQLELGEAA
jgi:hypothetical protein